MRRWIHFIRNVRGGVTDESGRMPTNKTEHTSGMSTLEDLEHCATASEDDQESPNASLDASPLEWMTQGGESPKQIAQFLYSQRYDNPILVGRALGEPDLRSLAALQEYANSYFTFKGYSFDICLRVFLGRFVLPGEAQKIDRILQAFGKAFFVANAMSDVFASADTAYTLAFSLVMLNTDAHNPHLPRRFKMRRHEFIRNYQGLGCDEEQLLSSEFLGQCYDTFVDEPLGLIPKRNGEELGVGDIELLFESETLGMLIETGPDGRSCTVKHYSGNKHVRCRPWSKPPSLDGYVIVSVGSDDTSELSYDMIRYLLRTSDRPLSLTLREPSAYFARQKL